MFLQLSFMGFHVPREETIQLFASFVSTDPFFTGAAREFIITHSCCLRLIWNKFYNVIYIHISLVLKAFLVDFPPRICVSQIFYRCVLFVEFGECPWRFR